MPRPSIRRKLAVALAAPLTALILLTVLEVAKASGEASAVSEQTELAEASIGPSGIVTALQNERTWIAVALVGQEEQVTVPVRGYEESRARTDATVAAFRSELGSHDAVVADAFRPALEQLDGLAAIRADIDARPGPHDLGDIDFAGEIFDRYTTLIDPFFDGTTRVALAIDDTELRLGAELADAATRQVETMSLLLHTTIIDATQAATRGESLGNDEITVIAMLQSNFKRYASILRSATGPYADLATGLYPEDLTTRVNTHVDAVVTTGEFDLTALLAAVDVPADEGYSAYSDELQSRIADRADELRSDAGTRQFRFALLAVLALTATISLTVAVSLSISRPLRSLTEQARGTARRHLPEAVRGVLETPLGDDVRVPHVAPVAVPTRDEVSDVVTALNTVQVAALDLAVEQAVLRRNIADSFVNLARRNQNLLGRQLDFITELESNETDPDTLAALFRLDHLATRMRRNAESLLVLAGFTPPRRWAAPVRVHDVVRAALGEVEDYQRVVLTGLAPASVLGSAAADLAHVVAELLENALSFSPPHRNVEVVGRPDIRSGGYQLAVVDTGLGMSADELERANRRLAGTESYTVAPSKYLGQYVAGRLAQRHGIGLRLHPTVGQGITASVELPPELLTADRAEALPPAIPWTGAQPPTAPSALASGQVPAVRPA